MRVFADQNLRAPLISASDAGSSLIKGAPASAAALRQPDHTACDLHDRIRAASAADSGAQKLRHGLLNTAALNLHVRQKPPRFSRVLPGHIDSLAASDSGAAIPSFGMHNAGIPGNHDLSAAHKGSAANSGAASVSVRRDIAALQADRAAGG